MKTKTYKHGKLTYKSYIKTAGKGYEVGFYEGTKCLFFGNFLHKKEATTWYSMMNREVTKFSKRYWVTPKTPKTFFNKFITNHLHKTYYAWLDKQFAQYNRSYASKWNQDERRYKQMRKNFQTAEKVYFKTAA
ncbi:MAG: hypothetical protein R2827_10900 [Bdellovibrionales bacterium]